MINLRYVHAHCLLVQPPCTSVTSIALLFMFWQLEMYHAFLLFLGELACLDFGILLLLFWYVIVLHVLAETAQLEVYHALILLPAFATLLHYHITLSVFAHNAQCAAGGVLCFYVCSCHIIKLLFLPTMHTAQLEVYHAFMLLPAIAVK